MLPRHDRQRDLTLDGHPPDGKLQQSYSSASFGVPAVAHDGDRAADSESVEAGERWTDDVRTGVEERRDGEHDRTFRLGRPRESCAYIFSSAQLCQNATGDADGCAADTDADSDEGTGCYASRATAYAEHEQLDGRVLRCECWTCESDESHDARHCDRRCGQRVRDETQVALPFSGHGLIARPGHSRSQGQTARTAAEQ